jgi:hypothetical protein
MRRLALGALSGAALSIAFKAATARDLLPTGVELHRRVRGRRRRHQNAKLDELTKEELYERARAKNIPGRSEMTKEELIAALRARGGGA